MASTSSTGLRKAVCILVKVKDIQPGTSGHNISAKVISCTVVVDRQRPDGSSIRVAECLVGDETGCILLTARNDQIDVVKPDESVHIRNAKVDMYKGFMRLAVDKWGLIRRAPEPAPFIVNTGNNLSAVEYELVNVPEDH